MEGEWDHLAACCSPNQPVTLYQGKCRHCVRAGCDGHGLMGTAAKHSPKPLCWVGPRGRKAEWKRTYRAGKRKDVQDISA